MSYISRLRELPPDRRKRAAFRLSAALTLLIVLCWLLLPSKEVVRESADLGPAFSAFGQAIGEQLDRLSSGWSDTVESFKAAQEAASSTEAATSTPGAAASTATTTRN